MTKLISLPMLLAGALLTANGAEIPATRPPRPRLQIINASTQPIDSFWLKSESERVPNGSVAPGRDSVNTTTVGHRFAIVGRNDFFPCTRDELKAHDPAIFALLETVWSAQVPTARAAQ